MIRRKRQEKEREHLEEDGGKEGRREGGREGGSRRPVSAPGHRVNNYNSATSNQPVPPHVKLDANQAGIRKSGML